MASPFRRAARWDGVVPTSREIEKPLTPAGMRDMVASIGEHRTSDAPFVVQGGWTVEKDAAEDAETVAPYAEAGVTWWLETRLPWLRPLAEVRERIRKGPPRV